MGSRAVLAVVVKVDGSVSSVVVSSTEEVASSPTFSREALSGAADWEQELRTAKSNPTKSNKTRFPKSPLTEPT
jgi:hypothetical protein